MKAIEMKNIVKEYPMVKAVDNVSFALERGEIHSLLGENGAGKSTLMKLMYGMTTPTSGEIYVNEKKVNIKNPKEAIKLGIGMVHQHFMLSPVLSVYENIIVGNEVKKGLFIDTKKAIKDIQKLIDRFNFKIDAREKVENLSTGEQQRVEILKAIYRGADVLILDEPTAVLTPQEVEELFTIMRNLKADNKSIVIITHKLKETLAIADKISVLRDGKMVAFGQPLDNVTTNDLAKLMVGRDVVLNVKKENHNKREEFVEIKNVTLKNKEKYIINSINLSISKGEILGIAGIEGNGQTELIEILTGIRKPDTMNFKIGNKEIKGNAADFIANKIGHIPEDRMSRGLVLDMSINENVILGYHDNNQFCTKGLMNKKEISKYGQKAINEYRIKTPNGNVLANSLSGGNQQKIVIARIFEQNPDFIVVAQPTRGVDVGAMEYIHSKLLELRDEGKAILLISADLDEVKALSDRIAVIYEGNIVKVQNSNEVDDIELGLLMTGSSK